MLLFFIKKAFCVQAIQRGDGPVKRFSAFCTSAVNQRQFDSFLHMLKHSSEH